MPRRSRQDMLAEFHRLRDNLEVCRAFDLEVNRDADPQIREVPASRPTRDQILLTVENGRPTVSDLLAGARQAVNDQHEQYGLSETKLHPDAEAFLAQYRDKTGRSFHEDAGNPRKRARLVLRRDAIADKSEYHFVNGIPCDADQTVFMGRDVDRINGMLVRFEAAYDDG